MSPHKRGPKKKVTNLMELCLRFSWLEIECVKKSIKMSSGSWFTQILLAEQADK